MILKNYLHEKDTPHIPKKNKCNARRCTDKETMELNIIHNTDCRSGLKTIPDNSIDCCVTSPPYYGLRDYGVKNQIGLEKTPEEYIAVMTGIFMEVYRVLTPDGTLWLNIGDSYGGSYRGWGDNKRNSKCQRFASYANIPNAYTGNGIKPKDLIGIPWMLAFALRNAGWYLRQDIIWHKLNPMPESVQDRCTKSHEYIFLFSKSAKYYFDNEAILEPAKYDGRKDTFYKGGDKDMNRTAHERWANKIDGLPARNKRDVWSVCTKSEKESHFAVFPDTLIADCIRAGCPENGIVLDPFMGSGTTAVVARKLNRNYIGFELNPDYVRIANRKLNRELGIFV